MEEDGNYSELWEEGTVFFNHLVRLMTWLVENTLWQVFYCGVAVFRPAGYGGCELVVPGFSSSGKQNELHFCPDQEQTG